MSFYSMDYSFTLINTRDKSITTKHIDFKLIVPNLILTMEKFNIHIYKVENIK